MSLGRRISEIEHLPVLDLESGELLGQIVGWVVNPTSQRLAAFVLQKSGLWQRARVIVPADIVEYGPKMVVVRDPSVVIDPAEVAGLPPLIAANMGLVGWAAEAEAGETLGQVSDFVFDTISSRLQQYAVRPSSVVGGFMERLIPATQVVRIDNRRIIFADKALKTKQAVAHHQAQTI